MEIKKILIFTTLVFALSLIVLILYPYILDNSSFLIGFDSGAYFIEINKYIDNSENLYQTVSLWQEPGLFLFLSSFGVFVNSVSGGFIIFFALYLLLLGLLSFIISRKLSGKSWVGILTVIILITSVTGINVIYKFFARQMVASIIFLVFLYFFSYFFIDNNDKKIKVWLIVLVLLSSFILYTHRAVSFLWVVLLLSSIVYNTYKKEYYKVRYLLILFIIPFLIASPYLLPIFGEQLIIFWEFLYQNYLGFTSNILIRDIAGDPINSIQNDYIINPIINYFVANMLLVSLSVLGLVKFRMNGYKSVDKWIIFIIIFLTLFSFFKFTFSNRFILNLDIIFLLFSGIFFLYNLKRKNKITILIISLLITVLVVGAFDTVSLKSPYINKESPGINFILNNIDKNNSLIFAPDYIQSMIGQIGYETPFTYKNLNFNYTSNLDDVRGLYRNDDFLVNGPFNISMICSQNIMDKNIYVILGSWNIDNPLPRFFPDQTLNLTNWDNSPHFNQLYEAEGEIIRIYRLKYDEIDIYEFEELCQLTKNETLN